MAIELKDIYKLLEFTPEDGKEPTMDQINDHFQKNFIGLEVAHERGEVIGKVLGKKLGEISTTLKNQFEDLGVSFEGKPIKEDGRVSYAKVLEFGTAEVKEQLKNLKEHAGKTDDKKIKELQDMIDKTKADYTIVIGERDNLKSLVEQKEQEFEGFKKNTVLSEKIKGAKSKIQFSDQANEFARKGFDVAFHEKYTIELSDTNDSEDGLRIISNATKQRVSKGNKFVTYEDLYKTELAEAKLLKMAETQNNNNNRVQFGNQNNQNNNNGQKEIKINSIAERIAAGETNL